MLKVSTNVWIFDIRCVPHLPWYRPAIAGKCGTHLNLCVIKKPAQLPEQACL